jgi:protein-tyrosine phosphatase
LKRGVTCPLGKVAKMFEIDHHPHGGGIWQGGMPTSKLDKRITAVVSLDIEWPMECQAWVDDEPAIHVLLLIPDAAFPGLKWLRMAVGIIESLWLADHIVYIHCREGVSRSVMLTAAWLMKHYRWRLDTAMEIIAAENPRLNPNPSFMRGLKEWQAELLE